jgi:hypothetical protein
MFKNFRDKLAASGITVLAIGLTLLIFTFVSAYEFLNGSLQIPSTQDLVQTFGGALAPLIVTAIRVMYLGIMGWVGSLITIRGVTIITNAPKAEVSAPQMLQEPQKEPQPRQAKSLPEKQNKPAEPEMTVIPPQEIEQQQAKS